MIMHLYPDIATTSSAAQAEMTSVGMPWEIGCNASQWFKKQKRSNDMVPWSSCSPNFRHQFWLSWSSSLSSPPLPGPSPDRSTAGWLEWWPREHSQTIILKKYLLFAFHDQNHQNQLTARETAASRNPTANPTVHGKPHKKWARIATLPACHQIMVKVTLMAGTSMKQGMKVALATITRSSHNLSGSNSRPALIIGCTCMC